MLQNRWEYMVPNIGKSEDSCMKWSPSKHQNGSSRIKHWEESGKTNYNYTFECEKSLCQDYAEEFEQRTEVKKKGSVLIFKKTQDPDLLNSVVTCDDLVVAVQIRNRIAVSWPQVQRK